MAARLFVAPMALVSLVDRDTILFLAVHGLDATVTQISRDDGLCGAMIAGDLPHLIVDALTDPRTADRAFVVEHRVRFYACAPLVTVGGYQVGAVAVMDTEARTATAEHLGMLDDLSALVVRQLDLQSSSQESLRDERRRRDAAEYALDDARLDRDAAQTVRDEARRDRDGARLDRRDAELERDGARRDLDDARLNRDNALRDRQIAERDLDLVEAYAAALQETLLPPLLPVVEGLSLATHYRPASPRQVGGDFYDVFPLGGGRWGFFLGDVEGHGVQAAVATSLIRYTLRSATTHHEDLAAALSELNAVMLGELSPRRFCTVILGTLTPRRDGEGFDVTLGTGGHQPALLIDPLDDAVHQVRPSSGMLVGLREDATFGTCCLRLRPGQTLLFYTDGLVEARRGSSAFDVDALSEFVGRRSATDAKELITDLSTLTTKLDPDDDVAVLALKATVPNPGQA